MTILLELVRETPYSKIMNTAKETTTYEVKQVSREKTIRGRITTVGKDWCVVSRTVTTYTNGYTDTGLMVVSAHGTDKSAASAACSNLAPWAQTFS